MKKIFLYISLVIVLAIAAFLIYRAVYTATTGPTDEELQLNKIKDSIEVSPANLDNISKDFADFEAEQDSTAKDSLK